MKDTFTVSFECLLVLLQHSIRLIKCGGALRDCGVRYARSVFGSKLTRSDRRRLVSFVRREMQNL